MQYAFAPTLYLAEIENDVVVLDLAQQRYKLIPFNEQKRFFPVSFFRALLQGNPMLQSHFQEALATCLKAGWLLEKPATSEEFAPLPLMKCWQRRWLPLRLEALFLLHRIDGVLQRHQFLPLVKALMALPVKPCQEKTRIARIVQAVHEMACLFGQSRTCLHQSIIMCWMLRERGIPAQVAIRVQQDPLRSHMMVVDGARVLSWKPGLSSITTLEHFLSASVLLFHSGELNVHYRRWEEKP
jgi:hypothetical protein